MDENMEMADAPLNPRSRRQPPRHGLGANGRGVAGPLLRAAAHFLAFRTSAGISNSGVAFHLGRETQEHPSTTEVALYDMRCDPGEGEQAGNLCRTLIDQSSREFPGINIVRLFNCLSPRKHLPEGLSLHALDVDLIVDDTLGSVFVDLFLGTDADEGGYVIRIAARR